MYAHEHDLSTCSDVPGSNTQIPVRAQIRYASVLHVIKPVQISMLDEVHHHLKGII